MTEPSWWETAFRREEKKRERWQFTSLILFMVLLFSGGFSWSIFEDRDTKWRMALDSIAGYDSTLVAQQSRVDSLARIAEARDTVLIRVVDSVEVATADELARAERARQTYETAADSLRARVDTTGERLLDQMMAAEREEDAADERRYRALEVRLGATERALIAERNRAQVQDSLLTTYRVRDGLHQQAEAALQREVASLRRKQSFTQKLLLGTAVVLAADLLIR